MRATTTRGGSSQDRRRARRAELRRRGVALEELTADQIAEIDDLVAAASDSLSLSDRDAGWDAGAAAQTLEAPDLSKAFFWRGSDEPADQITSYKLGFASKTDATLTAIWKGVTAAAGAVQGARGGADIPSGDEAAVKSRIASYYAKARAKYADPNIKEPWRAGAGESAAQLLAYAEVPGLTAVYEDGRFSGVEADDVDQLAIYAGRLLFWEDAFAAEPAATVIAEAMVRIQPVAAPFASPEDLALATVDAAFQHATGCECGHGLSEHVGSDGPCKHEDGRGTCRCGGFAEMKTEDSAQADALGVRIRFPEEAIRHASMMLVQSSEHEIEGDFAGPLASIDRLQEGLERGISALVAPLCGCEDAPVPDGMARFVLRDFVFETLPEAMQPGERLPDPNGGAPEPTPAQNGVAARGPYAWKALFVPEATLTDDGRAMAPGSLDWRELPLTLMGLNETSAEGGHDGAVACGRIDRIWREGNYINAVGVFSEDEIGSYFATNVDNGSIRGLSVDIAIHEYEVGPKSDYFDEDGNWLSEKPARVEDAPSLDDVLFDSDVEDRIFVVTKGVIGMATVCPFPAFAEANISLQASGAIWRYSHQGRFEVVQRPALEADADELAAMPACANCDHAYADHADEGACGIDGCSCSEYDADAEPDGDPDDLTLALTAAAAGLAPLNPPAEWLANPELQELTPLTITEEGRVYGHAWGWDTCHTGIPGTCTKPPRSRTGYAYFHVGEIECENGETVAVGRITFDTGHAGQRLSRSAALAHYDDTGKIGAYVVVGEDAYGGWVAGTLAAAITPEQAQTIRGSAPSGDWRDVNGNLELIALLSVNVPGFPVPRPRALVAAAGDEMRIYSLTAAGALEMLRERTQEDDFREIAVLAAQARGDFDDLLEQARA